MATAESEALLASLAAMSAELERLAARIGPDWGLVRDATGGFALVEHAWHLADLEREGFGARIERLLREDEPFLPNFDGARVARERAYRRRPLADGLYVFAHARQANLDRLAALTEAQWERSGEQEGVGPVRLRDLPRLMAEHDAAHRQEMTRLATDVERAGQASRARPTERLVLTPFAWSHEAALLRLFNDEQVGRSLWDGEPVTREVLREQIASSLETFRDRGFGHFAACLRGEPERVVGFAGLRTIGETNEVELLYALEPACWKQGLATEAAREVLRVGFEEAGLSEILAGADPPNAASFRVMERLGMAFARETTMGGRKVRYYSARGVRRSRERPPAE